MITVTVRYHNLLRRLTGFAEEALTLSAGASLRDLLEALAHSHGPPLREMLFEPDGRVSLHLVIFHNRQLVRLSQHDATLSDGDVLMLFPALSGG